jgi:hypothetical protein
VNCVDEVCELGMGKTLNVVVLSKRSLNRTYNSYELYIQTLYKIKLNAFKQTVAVLADPVCLEVAPLFS